MPTAAAMRVAGMLGLGMCFSLSACASAPSRRGTPIVDRTYWQIPSAPPLVSEVSLTLEFASSVKKDVRPRILGALHRELSARGLGPSDGAPFELELICDEASSGAHGFPVLSRYALITFQVALRQRDSGEALVSGRVDGLVEEGDVNWLPIGDAERLDRAIDAAVGKIGRQLVALGSAHRSASQTPYGRADARIRLEPLPLANRPTLAVLDFQTGEGVSEEVGRALGDVCRDAIRRTEQYRLIDRQNMVSILGEHDFASAVKCLDGKCLVRFGRMLHAQKMVHGSLSRVGESHVLYLSMTDVSTSLIESTVSDTLEGGIEKAATAMPEKALELVVAAVTPRE